jgi:OmpA-OmpF porin, OOP family
MKLNQMMNLPAIGALALATLIGLPAAAQESGWYFGANAGESRATIDEETIVDNLLGAGFATPSFREDERHFGYKAFGGYRLNRYFALEGGYVDLGNFNFEATTAPAGTLDGEIKIKGVNLDLVGFIPFNDKFAVFGRAGAIHAEAKDSFSGSGAVVVLDPDRRERDTNYKLGVGLQYNFTPSFAMRAEAERYRINDAVGNDGDIDLFSLGVLFGFGGPAAQVAPSAPPPPDAVPEPTPPPPPPEPPRDSDNDGVTDDIDKCPGTPRGVAVDAVGCPLKGSVTLEGINFEYNSASLTAESRTILGELAANLKKYPRLRIELQGHTDSVGGDAYNRALSQRRADSVRQYLIEHGVAADRLTARGYGEAQPVDRNDTDAGRARNRRVVMDVIANPGEVEIEGEGSAQ